MFYFLSCPQHSPFFAEQLTAFQVWLTMGVENRNPPEQLPIVLQVHTHPHTHTFIRWGRMEYSVHQMACERMNNLSALRRPCYCNLTTADQSYSVAFVCVTLVN